MEQNFSLDRDLCTQCGQCVYACNRQILAVDGEGYPFLSPEKFEMCNACGHCSAICPADAVVPPRCGGEKAVPFPGDPALDTAAGEAFLLSCRSIRRYKQEPVKKEAILDILDVARKAPSASNMQPVRWIVLNGRDKAERFTALTLEWFDTVLRHDPVFSRLYNVDTMLARYRGGYDVILRGAPNAVIAVTDKTAAWAPTDSAIAVTYFCLAAQARGIGSCWCGFGMRALESYQPLRDFVGVDDASQVQGMAFFGYPEIAYNAVPPRKPLRVAWL